MKQVIQIKSSDVISAEVPIRLHVRTDLHLARKAWHMSMGLLMIAVYSAGMSRATAVITLSSVLGLDFLVEMARFRIPAFNEKVMRFFGPIMRASEMNKISSASYYIAATTLAVCIFPKPIAILAIAYLAFGDPLASFVGLLYGKVGPRLADGKSLIGTLTGVVVCSIVTIVFLSAFGVTEKTALVLTLIGGIAGGTAELLPLEVDDNFSIPIVSGFVLWLAFILLGV